MTIYMYASSSMVIFFGKNIKNIILKYQILTKVVLNFEKALYCKSGNFRENFIVANGAKIHICDD